MSLKVLIIHSDDYFRANLLERMRLEKYLACEASPETEAREVLRERSFDVVLLGVTGNRQKSLSLLRSIKELQHQAEVILLTAGKEHSLSSSMQAMRLGAFDDLLVPVDMNALLKRVQEAYKTSRKKALEGRDPQWPNSA